MTRNKIISRMISIVVLMVFLWTNCVWAVGVSANKLAAQTQVSGLLGDARIVYIGTAVHSAFVSRGIEDLETLNKNWETIIAELRRTIGGAVNGLKTLVFAGEGGHAYYTFHPDGYFYRFTTAETVDDPFNRLISKFIAARGEKVPVPIDGNTYYQEIIQIPAETFKLINTALGELYPEEKLRDLSKFSGIPVSLDMSSSTISLGDGVESDAKWERPLKDAGNSIAEPSIIGTDPDRVVYYGYRDVRMGRDTDNIDRHKLRFDITVLMPGVIGEEFIMTKGHIHPGDKYPEFYEIWNGTALYIQQGINPDTGRFEVIATLARPGDKVLLIPRYSHRTVNISDEPLVMANWISHEVGGKERIAGSCVVRPDFSEIEAKNGYAYHVIKGSDGSVVLRHNPKYGTVPADIRFALPAERIPELGLSRDEPMYLQNSNDLLGGFLNDPNALTGLFSSSFRFVDIGELGISINVNQLNRLFRLGSAPASKVPDNIAVGTSSLTAAVLTKLGLRGKALGLDKVKDKKVIAGFKDKADGLAKRIFEWVVKAADVVLRVRVSEGFGRDEVAESFVANEVVNPSGKNGIVDAIIDVIEGTNAFVYDVNGKKLDELSGSESGGTSIIVTGKGVESLGNCPDVYTDGIFTIVPKDKRQDFVDNPLDPELTANDPMKIEEALTRIAEANGIGIGDLEVVLLDRTREAERLAVLRGLQERFSGLEITIIKDGTVAHSLLATFGRKEGKHKVVMTVGGAPEGFLNLAVASIFRDEGAVASIRVYSKNVNKTIDGKDAQDLSRRYNFSDEEKAEIRKLRPDDAEDIIAGRKLFTQEDVKGDVEGSFAFITHNGVFKIEGAKKQEDGSYKVTVLRVGNIDRKPSVWFEDKVISKDKIESFKGEDAVQGSHLTRKVEAGEGETHLNSMKLDENGVLGNFEIEGVAEIEKIGSALDRLRHIYGAGIFTKIGDIEIVRNLGGGGYPDGRAPLASFRDGVLRIDELAFRYGEYLLFEELEHEFLESIAVLIPGATHALADVISTFRNVKRFLELGADEKERFLDFLGDENPIDPDGEYLSLLRRLSKIRDVTEDEIIASVVRYALRTKLYENVRDELGLPEELAGKIRDLEPRLDDALAVFYEIKEAVGLVEKVKESTELAIRVVKTFTGIRVQGLEKIDKKLAEVVAVLVKIASKTGGIASLPLAMAEGRYYIVVDRNRVTKEMEEAIRKLEKNNVFKVVYTVPEDYEPKKIIYLVDPGDLREGMQEGILYLPMPYLRSSLYMAANIVSAGGEVAKVDPLVKGLIIDLYKVTEEDLSDLFNAPWRLLPKIKGVITELNKLKDAWAEIEKAA